jgi:HSP20 family protein
MTLRFLTASGIIRKICALPGNASGPIRDREPRNDNDEEEEAMTTGLIRWNPESDLLRGRMDRLFNEMVQSVFSPLPASEGVSPRAWAPPVDIRETDEALVLTAELPGMTKEDVEITLENSVLTLSGERKIEKDTKGETWHRVERAYGGFSRSFTLPATVRTDRVEAAFANGVLTVTLPKMEESKPRRISIK